jgi:hypothetical protein
MKIRPVGVKLYYEDRLTGVGWKDEHGEANSRFLQIWERA